MIHPKISSKMFDYSQPQDSIAMSMMYQLKLNHMRNLVSLVRLRAIGKYKSKSIAIPKL